MRSKAPNVLCLVSDTDSILPRQFCLSMGSYVPKYCPSFRGVIQSRFTTHQICPSPKSLLMAVIHFEAFWATFTSWRPEWYTVAYCTAEPSLGTSVDGGIWRQSGYTQHTPTATLFGYPVGTFSSSSECQTEMPQGGF